jgi:hypothetical protein
MHDIDRNILETSFEGEVFEYEGPNYETWSGEYQEYEAEAFGEAEAMELAAELLEVSNEQDLEQFLGGLLKKVGIKLPDMQAVGGVLKGLAKKALPLAATAAGSFFGGPIGAKIGNAVGKFAASKIPDELESLSQEDREFEGAKQFVQIAGQVARQVADSGQLSNPQAIKHALVQTLRRNAPGLLQAIGTRAHSNGGSAEYEYGGGGQWGRSSQDYSGGGASQHTNRARTGRWVRRGHRIVLLGV